MLHYEEENDIMLLVQWVLALCGINLFSSVELAIKGSFQTNAKDMECQFVIMAIIYYCRNGYLHIIHLQIALEFRL